MPSPQLPSVNEPITHEEQLRISRPWLRYLADLGSGHQDNAHQIATLNQQIADLQSQVQKLQKQGS